MLWRYSQRRMGPATFCAHLIHISDHTAVYPTVAAREIFHVTCNTEGKSLDSFLNILHLSLHDYKASSDVTHCFLLTAGAILFPSKILYRWITMWWCCAMVLSTHLPTNFGLFPRDLPLLRITKKGPATALLACEHHRYPGCIGASITQDLGRIWTAVEW